MPEDGVVCLDNGMYKIWFARTYRTHVANTLLLDNALATMASILPPRRRVLAVCGDGGFMMNSRELETATRLGLNLVVLILQDNAFGMIRWEQEAYDWRLSFGNPDFSRYAEAVGAKGSRVETANGLVPAVEVAFKAGGVPTRRSAGRLLGKHSGADPRAAPPPADPF
jgi:acetolactate synthase I/II/III large subunit